MVNALLTSRELLFRLARVLLYYLSAVITALLLESCTRFPDTATFSLVHGK